MTQDNTIRCQHCGLAFSVLCDGLPAMVDYCPFCGSDMADEEEDDDDV